ncbi:hypothetical protein B0H13DRAFT_195354 [Mycena leptocephala]|nr:hypothetical protein B0H13DRAFT_195354 [Mycena leptocephala]
MQLMSTFSVLMTCLPLLVSASPVPSPGSAHLPSGTTMLGFDDDGSSAVAYSSTGAVLGNVSVSSLPRRDTNTSGTCASLDAMQMQQIPGWSKLEAQAKAFWGSGDWTIKSNPPAWLDEPAIVCVNDRGAANPPKIVTTGSPNCADSSQSTDGQFIGAAGTVSLTGNEGTTASSTTTVTKQSSIGVDETVEVEVDFPLIAKFTSKVTLKSDFTNTLAKATTTSTNTMQGRTFTINPTAGQTCHLEYQASSCTVSGTGSIPWVASGWAWFVYKHKTQGHWNWALLMEAYLTDEADRTSNMEVSVAMSSTTNSNYSAICTGGQASGAGAASVSQPQSDNPSVGAISSKSTKAAWSTASSTPSKPSAGGDGAPNAKPSASHSERPSAWYLHSS